MRSKLNAFWFTIVVPLTDCWHIGLVVCDMKGLLRYRFSRLTTVVSLIFGLSVSAQIAPDRTATFNAAAVVRPLFDLRSPERSPFPSDVFTVADATQNTGRRVNLPMPQDCATHPSDCEDVAVLNQLDGFNMQARISVPFDGDIDPSTVSSKSIFLVKLRDALSGRTNDSSIVGINYIVWDPITRELSFRPEDSLEQQTTYALVVTTGVRSAKGTAIGVAEGFRVDRDIPARDADADYRRALDGAEPRVRPVLARGMDIAALSVFTTQTFSHIVERMREAVQRAQAPTLNFAIGPEGARAVFDASRVQTLTNNAHINTQGPLTSEALTNALGQMREVPGAVGSLAFGTYRTLDFTMPGSGHIAPIPTRSGTLVPTGAIDVAFNLWLPSGSKPAAGWPVAIYGHGSFGSKNAAFAHAAVLASHGVAVIAINGLARGGGPLTTMTVTSTDGNSMTFRAPGLGQDVNGDGTIDTYEPFRARRPHALLNLSGPMLNAAAQQFALVRAIQSGVDADGDGARDLDGSRIYYVGQSEGSTWGVGVFAYEPVVRAAVFVVPTGTTTYNANFSAASRSLFAQLLAQRTPSVINSDHGLTHLDGVSVDPPHYNDNLPLRNEVPRVTPVPGARTIQRVIDHMVWAAQPANPVAYAALLRRAPVSGVPPRPFLLQVARSDRSVVNPSTSDVIRSGDFPDRVALYRHDLNLELLKIQPNPHGFLSGVNFQQVRLGAQHQIGAFFASDGSKVIHPTPTDLWEWPIETPLEGLFYLPRSR